MAKERTHVLATERIVGREAVCPQDPFGRTMPKVGGLNASQNTVEQAIRRTRTSGGQKIRGWQGSKAHYRNVRPHTGKVEESHDTPREEYTGPEALLISLARTPKQRRLADKVRELQTERAQDAKYGDIPAERLAKLEAHIRAEADFLAGVTTGDVNRAALVAEAARKCL